MAEEQKILSIIDYINQNNICNKYLNKLKNIIGSSNVEILSRVKEKQSALDKMKVRHFVSANQISDFVGYMIITDTVEDVYKIKNRIENNLGNCLEEDYIKNPKNGYKSIHLNYLVEKNIPLEIQIKTKQMKAAQDIVHDKIYKNFNLSEELRNVLSNLVFLKVLKQ